MLEENTLREEGPSFQMNGYKPSLHVDVNVDASIDDTRSTSVTPKTAMTPHVPTNIFVAGLPSSWDDESLRIHYKDFGEIVSTRVVTNRHFGFVMFRKPEAAHAAINATHLTRPLPDCPTLLHVSIAMHDEGVDDLPNERIFVRGLPQWATKEHLVQTFSKYGKIVECAVLMNSLGQCKGSGFVHFETETEAASVIQNRNNLHVEGWNQPLEIKYSESAEVRQQRQERNRNRQRNWVWSPKSRNSLILPMGPTMSTSSLPLNTMATSIPSSSSSQSAMTAAVAAAVAAAAAAASNSTSSATTTTTTSTTSMPSTFELYSQPQFIMPSTVNLPLVNTLPLPIMYTPQTSLPSIDTNAFQPMLNSCNTFTVSANPTINTNAFYGNSLNAPISIPTPITTTATPTLTTQGTTLLSPSFIHTALPSPQPTQIIYPTPPIIPTITANMTAPSTSSVANTTMLMISNQSILPQKGDLHFSGGPISEELLRILIEPYGKIETMKTLSNNNGIVVRMLNTAQHSYISQLLNGTVFSNGQILAVGLYA